MPSMARVVYGKYCKCLATYATGSLGKDFNVYFMRHFLKLMFNSIIHFTIRGLNVHTYSLNHL